MMSERQMKIWYTIRGWLSAGVFVAIVVLLGLAVASYFQNGTFANSLANSWVTRCLASRYGITYSVDSIRIRSLDGIANFQVEAEGIEFDLETEDPLQSEVARFYFAREGPLSIDHPKIEFESKRLLLAAERVGVADGVFKINKSRFDGPSSDLSGSIDAIEVSTEELNAAFRGVKIPSGRESDSPSVRVAEVLTSPPLSSERSLRFEQINLSGVNVQIPARETSAPMCEEIWSQVSAGGDIVRPIELLLEAIPDLIKRLQSDLSWLPWIAVAILFLVKLFVTIWIYCARRPKRLPPAGKHFLLGLAAVLPPVVVFVLGSRTLSLPWMLVAAALASLAVAFVLRRMVYRHAGVWYQRWEPFAVDCTAFLIVPVLTLQGLELPPLPDLPSTFQIDRLEAVRTSVIAGAERCEDAYQIHLTSPRTQVAGVEASLGDSSGEGLSLAVADIEIPNSLLKVSSVSDSDSRRELASVSTDSTLHGIRVRVDAENQRIEDFRAGIGLSGEAASSALREELRRVRFLAARAEQLARATFDLNLELRGSGETVTAADLPEPDSSQSQFSGQALVSFDSEQCAAQPATNSRTEAYYAANGHLRVADADIKIAADGDLQVAHIRSILSTAGSAVKVAGSGEIALGERVAPQLTLNGLEALLGSYRLSVDSTKFDAAIPVSCTPSGAQRFSVAVDGASISTTEDGESYVTKIAKAIVGFHRDLDTPSGDMLLDTRLENIQVTGHRGDPAAGSEPKLWLDADLPAAQLALAGRTSAGTLPSEFDGTLSASFKAFDARSAIAAG